ncbi:pregnancy-associated plasma -A family protein, partial [Vibrio parahaemolyticus V-223/04]
LRKLRMDAS